MLTIITVTRDNLDELVKTVASVSRQSETPGAFLVVDSSSDTNRRSARRIAEDGGADYRWVPPKGVYSAMRESMAMVPLDSYLWWLNSSDWLASEKSVAHVSDFLRDLSVEERPNWVVGGLIRVEGHAQRLRIHERGGSGSDFFRGLTVGRYGFPHPSTLFWGSSLAEINPYPEKFRVAGDYATAIRFGRKFGAPAFLDAALSIHVANGLTSQHIYRHFVEKSLARASMGTLGWMREPRNLGMVAMELIQSGLRARETNKAIEIPAELDWMTELPK